MIPSTNIDQSHSIYFQVQCTKIYQCWYIKADHKRLFNMTAKVYVSHLCLFSIHESHYVNFNLRAFLLMFYLVHHEMGWKLVSNTKQLLWILVADGMNQILC